MDSTTHTNNVIVGAGEFYIDLEGGASEIRGERYLGDCAGGSLSITSERITVFSGDGAVAQKLVDSVRSIERSMTITLRDMSPDNLALFVGASSIEDITDSANAVTDEELTVRPGRWYQLGIADDKPTGVGAISTTLSVAASRGSTTYRANTDYVADAARGRIYIVPGGNITSGTTLHVDYTPLAATRQQVRTGALKDIRGAIRYIETPTAGQGRDYYAPVCSIASAGELALKSRDSEQQIQLTISILEPGNGKAALYIDGEAA